MKRTVINLSVLVVIAFTLPQSCKKEYSCEGCSSSNIPPIAVAGVDQIINFPKDSASLDGSSSYDPDGKIEKWRWTKISGPASFGIQNFYSAKTIVETLIQGVYQFELSVTDDKGASAKDTIELVVENKPVDSIRADSLIANSHPCVMNISNIDTYLSPGVKFEVYIRYYWGTGSNGFSGSFFKIDTIPDAQTFNQPLLSYWYWYEYSNGLLTVHYPYNILCDWDPGYHDVIIKW